MLELSQILATFRAMPNTAERLLTLIEFASCYVEPPAAVARRPYPCERRLSGCDVDIYFWAIPSGQDTLDFFFAVEADRGISAKAFAVILSRCFSGVTAEQVVAMPPTLVCDLFGPDLAPDKRRTLEAMAEAVRNAAADMLSS